MSTWIKRKGIMLCYPFEEKRLLKWAPPYLVQPKLNGERMRAILDKEGNCTLLSSEENEITSLPHIKETLENSGLKDIELDGEAYCHGMPFEEIHSIVSRKVNMHEHYWKMNYHTFDLINSDNQLQRLADLASLFYHELENLDVISLVYTYQAMSLEDILEMKERFYSQGYEGIIVRNMMAPYARKRYIYIMKFKPKKDDYYRIIGYKEEISKDGVLKGRLGAFICCGDDEEEFSVGSGVNLTHTNRQTYWDNKEDLIGKYVHVEYQNLTRGRGVPLFGVSLSVVDQPF